MNRAAVFAGCLLCVALAATSSAQGGSERATGQINDALSNFFGAGNAASVTPEQAAAVDPAQFEYAYNPALVPQVQALVLAVLPDTPESREAAQGILDQLTLEQQQAIMAEGFPDGTWSATNLVDVVSATVLFAYSILQNLDSTTPQQDAAVRDLFRVAFANTDLVNLSDADKQLATEPLLLATILNAAQYGYAKEGLPGFSLPDSQESARQLLQAFGLDPQFFALGADGLEPTPQMQKVQSGELTMEEAFPEVMAQLNALGAQPVVPGADTGGATIQPPPTDTTTPAPPDTTPTVTPPDTPPDTNPSTPTSTQTAGTDGNNPLQPINPLAPPTPDPFVGVFEGDALTLTLEGSGTYTGSLNLRGQTYPVQATTSGDVLNGTFSSGGATFAFTATLAGAVLSLESDGNRFTLERQAPANPLGN